MMTRFDQLESRQNETLNTMNREFVPDTFSRFSLPLWRARYHVIPFYSVGIPDTFFRCVSQIDVNPRITMQPLAIIWLRFYPE